MSGAFHGDAGLKRKLLDRLTRHRDAGTLTFRGPVWDGTGGSPLGVSIRGTDIDVYASSYGYPPALAAILDLLAGFSDPDSAGFAIGWVAAVRPGADLARIPALLAIELLAHPVLSNAPRAIVAELTALHQADADATPAPRERWRAVRGALAAPSADGLPPHADGLLETLGWPAAARSTLVGATTGLPRLAAAMPRPEWPHAHERRAIAILHDLREEAAADIAAGAIIDYRARLTARDPALAAGFFTNLEATNRIAIATAHSIARRCMAMLRAA